MSGHDAPPLCASLDCNKPGVVRLKDYKGVHKFLASMDIEAFVEEVRVSQPLFVCSGCHISCNLARSDVASDFAISFGIHSGTRKEQLTCETCRFRSSVYGKAVELDSLHFPLGEHKNVPHRMSVL